MVVTTGHPCTITDDLPTLVSGIIADLARHQEGSGSFAVLRNDPPAHGVQRLYDGLDLGELVSEYNLLRVAFSTVAANHGFYIVGRAMDIINHHIDSAVRGAVMAFAARQRFMLKERDDEYLAFIVHDLRTPLLSASLVAEELRTRMDDKSYEETHELFELQMRSLQRIEDLIKQVLASKAPLSPLGSCFQPERRTFELWPLVQRLVLDLRSVSAQSSIVVINSIPKYLTVDADAMLVSQVFQNLLGNAFKYSARGKVIVSAIEADGAVTCIVQDNGAGIRLDMLDKVFEKMETDPDKTGTGLGLAIVKQIVEAHGGKVSAASMPGAGATFSFTIPPRQEAAYNTNRLDWEQLAQTPPQYTVG